MAVEPNIRFIIVFALTLSLLLLSAAVYLRHCVVRLVESKRYSYTSGLMVTEACLQCICEASDECASFKVGQICGKYRISQDYWVDGGQPRLEGAVEGADESLEVAYLRCVNSPFCAARTVSGYVEKHMRDCNKDGVIDCYDYARIHIIGHRAASHLDLNSSHASRLHNCMKRLWIRDNVEILYFKN